MKLDRGVVVIAVQLVVDGANDRFAQLENDVGAEAMLRLVLLASEEEEVVTYPTGAAGQKEHFVAPPIWVLRHVLLHDTLSFERDDLLVSAQLLFLRDLSEVCFGDIE